MIVSSRTEKALKSMKKSNMKLINRKEIKQMEEQEILFNIDEWISTKPSVIKKERKILFNDDQIRVSVKNHKKLSDRVWMSFAFRKRILMLLGTGKINKIIVLKHKNDPNRLLLIRSENGYVVNIPDRKRDYFFFKAYIHGSTFPEGIYTVEPIFHEKGINSGSIIEVRLTPDNLKINGEKNAD